MAWSYTAQEPPIITSSRGYLEICVSAVIHEKHIHYAQLLEEENVAKLSSQSDSENEHSDILNICEAAFAI